MPGKNIADFLGKPLMAHTVEQAVASRAFTAIAISSDSQSYLDIGMAYGATDAVLRPAELASDRAAKLPVIRHCAETVEKRYGAPFDIIVDLQVTSPLRLPEDILGAIALLEGNDAIENVITGSPAKDSPYFTIVERDTRGAVALSKRLDKPVIRRQDAPACYVINGSIYVWRRATLFAPAGMHDGVVLDHTGLYEMPEHRSVDIDSRLDFLLAEFVGHRIDLKTGQFFE